MPLCPDCRDDADTAEVYKMSIEIDIKTCDDCGEKFRD